MMHCFKGVAQFLTVGTTVGYEPILHKPHNFINQNT